MRQLNFYGFRKIKSDAVLLEDESESTQSEKFWRFRHENFQRGKVELLSKIQRAAHSSPNITQEDFKKMKDDMNGLRETVEDLTDKLAHVLSKIEPMVIEL